MPFTFSHPALILPLNYLPKKWFSMTGLIIGSLTPDFEYFIRMKIKSNYSHTILGILYFDLPLGILLSFIFHNIVKNDLFQNLPNQLKSRFLNIEMLEWNNYFSKNWIVVIVSIIIGTISHLMWDSFTHEGGYVVSHVSFLSNSVDLFGKEIKYLKILQHTSTLFGGLIILHTIYKLPKTALYEVNINLKYWLFVTLITSCSFFARIEIGENTKLIGNIIANFLASFMIGLIITPFLLNKKTHIKSALQ